MNLAASAPTWLLVIVTALLVAGAVEDLWRLRISNLISLGVLATAVVAMVLAGFETILWQNLLVFALILLIGTLLFSFGFFGGGDVKLFAACGLWFSLAGAITLVWAIFLAGGAVALLILCFRRVRGKKRGTGRQGKSAAAASIPYGVAIAAGAIFALFTPSSHANSRADIIGFGRSI